MKNFKRKLKHARKMIVMLVTLLILSACASDFTTAQYVAAFSTGFADMDRQSGAAYGNTINFQMMHPQVQCTPHVDGFGNVTSCY